MRPTNSLTGKQLIHAVLSHEPVAVIPWVPFAGVHSGKLKGFSAREVLQDEHKLLESLLEVNRIYEPDGQPVIFDLQVEAEILACQLKWDEKSPPSVVTHPLENDLNLPTHLPQEGEGRLPLILNVMRRMQEQVGQTTALYGLVTGPLTLASHLRGTDLFMDTFDRPDFLQELLAYCTSVCLRMSQMYIQAGMDVIAVVDPVVSQISPRHMERFLLNPYKEIFQSLRSQKVFSSIFVCGDATKNLDLLCQSGPDCLAVDENIDMKAAWMVADNYQITLQGNIPLTSCMLLGSQQDNMKYVVDLIDSLCGQGESIPQNLIISPGCDMPYEVPAENVIGILQAIREPHTVRQMLANYHSRAIDLESIAIPDYAHLERPLVEVFTLDSSTCAACGYMLMAAQRAARDLEGKMDMVEYKATSAENIARMARMGVKNLPAILINGELKFSSLIPGNAELVEAIRQKMR